MNDILEIMKSFKDYTFVVIIGFLVGIIFLLSGYEKEEINTKGELVRFTVFGILSSMFITYLGYEIFNYMGLPNRLSIALGGGVAYLGADKISSIIEKLIQKKLDKL